MDFDRLWAPWRMDYVAADQASKPQPSRQLALPEGADPNCFICRGAADGDDRANLVIHRTDHCITILNRYPYNNGHLLVAPLVHKSGLAELTSEEQLDSVGVLATLVDVLATTMKADGFNVGLNLGRAAGAGLPGHIHWHIVPRWNGDTNFMPVLAGTKVIPQSLDALWEILHERLAAS